MRDGASSYSWAEVGHATKSANSLERVFTILSEPISYFILNYTRLSPNAVTLLGVAFGICGAWFSLREEWFAAFFAYAIFFLLDCCDGAVARASGRTSASGAKLDLYGDRIVLFAAVLCRVAAHLDHAEAFPAWLCVLYLISHYIGDLGWLMRLRSQLELPSQWAELKGEMNRQVQAKRVSNGGEAAWWRRWLSQAARAEREFEPTAWVCNIAFIAGACLVPQQPAPLYIAAIIALQWTPAMYWARRLVKAGLRPVS